MLKSQDGRQDEEEDEMMTTESGEHALGQGKAAMIPDTEVTCTRWTTRRREDDMMTTESGEDALGHEGKVRLR